MPVTRLPRKSAAKDLERVSRDADVLEERWDELIRLHPNEWVGVYGGEIICATSLEQLLEDANERQWDLGLMVIDRLAEKRAALLL